ncbi:intermembrane transport protein PqiB [Parendozoicomonas sp. Alg238-R29]|uniref:intermembrane transport protein PqiB n=1 Tax=Parendozoicomonas sp. Alg238-R29 TaxID=2993446 RepID=UPI00248EF617|nr:intermembrane transport protein PqiB [Parendozoicomonas sp. Alg238-R29]
MKQSEGDTTSDSGNAIAEARIETGRRVSVLWILPLVALLIGGWMLWSYYSSLGPQVTISFETADGIEAGKTQVKYRSVVVGQVTAVQLNKELNGVKATVQMTAESKDLMRDDSRFWIVRPRVSAGGVSGLSTLLSGTYIEMSPGKEKLTKGVFIGDETPPVSDLNAEGLRVTLYSQEAGSLGVGDPVLYSGFRVGQLEDISFDLKIRKIRYQLFIHAPYSDLVTDQTRFWNTSGFDLKAGASGIQLRTGSLESLISGGIAFTTPEGTPSGKAVQNNHLYRLYADFSSINEREYAGGYDFVLLFDEPVRGLLPGAAVDYRGIQIGVVERIAYDLMDDVIGDDSWAIPVVITIQPERFNSSRKKPSGKELVADMQLAVEKGLRASLKSGNLLTGSLYVDMDFRADASKTSMKIKEYQGYPVIPAEKTGLAQIGDQVSNLLVKLNSLPLEKTLNELQNTLARAEELLGASSTRQVPDNINDTMDAARKMLEGYSADGEVYGALRDSLGQLKTLIWQLQPLVKQVNQQPNTLIFGRTPGQDPEPVGE